MESKTDVDNEHPAKNKPGFCWRFMKNIEFTVLGSLFFFGWYLVDIVSDVFVCLPFVGALFACEGHTGACGKIKTFECKPRDFKGSFDNDDHWYEECPVSTAVGFSPVGPNDTGSERIWPVSAPIRVLSFDTFHLDRGFCLDFVNTSDSSSGQYAGFPIGLCSLIDEKDTNNDLLCDDNAYNFTADYFIGDTICLSDVWVIWRLLTFLAVLGFIVTIGIGIFSGCKNRHGITSLQLYMERFVVSTRLWINKEEYKELTHPAGELGRSYFRYRAAAFVAELLLEVGSIMIAIFVIK